MKPKRIYLLEPIDPELPYFIVSNKDGTLGGDGIEFTIGGFTKKEAERESNRFQKIGILLRLKKMF